MQSIRMTRNMLVVISAGPREPALCNDAGAGSSTGADKSSIVFVVDSRQTGSALNRQKNTAAATASEIWFRSSNIRRQHSIEVFNDDNRSLAPEKCSQGVDQTSSR